MRSGCLRHRVAIQGLVSGTWTTETTVWAFIDPIVGKRYENIQLKDDVSHVVRIRYLSGITAAKRLVYDSRIFEIKSIANPRERRKELVLYVKESDFSAGVTATFEGEEITVILGQRSLVPYVNENDRIVKLEDGVWSVAFKYGQRAGFTNAGQTTWVLLVYMQSSEVSIVNPGDELTVNSETWVVI